MSAADVAAIRLFPDFAFVDLAMGGPHRRNNPTRWDAVHVNGTPDSYTTVHRFGKDFLEYVQRTGSVRGWAGPSWADFLVFDIDEKEDLEKARLAALALIWLLIDTYGVKPDQVRMFFSGQKGFHVLVAIELFGPLMPSSELAGLLKDLALEIAAEAGVQVDTGIYDRTRLFRLPNTRHSGSGLYKIELSWDEIVHLDADAIRGLASSPRDFVWTPDHLEALPALEALLERVDEREPGSSDEHSPPPSGEGLPDDALALLAAVPASVGHDDWLRVGMALHDADRDAGLRLWDDWSATCPEQYPGPEEIRRRWDSFDEERRARVGGKIITVGSLRHMAMERGYRPTPGAASKVGRDAVQGVQKEDFYAYMVQHQYLFVPSRDLWPSSSVNARIPPIQVCDADGNPVLDDKGKPKTIPAATWLDQNRPVEQMTWYPGEPMVIEGRLIAHGGWLDRPGCRTFNLYRPPVIELGDPAEAGAWIDHTRRVYPAEADHIIRWLAHRRQRPHEKVNHALVLAGAQGTGKDSIIQGAVPAVGPWNVAEVSPDQLLGRFNGFIKSVIIRVSEARDLGDTDRNRLYDHLKTYTAAPPDVLRCDEKHLREYAVPNVSGVVITSNYIDGIFLPADDRRHFVAWTDLTKDDFTEAYWLQLYGWYEAGGYEHVAAYLDALDLSDFNPKAPPPKTAAFWQTVDAGRAPEDAELADALDRLGNPDAVTLSMIADHADPSFGEWLRDRRNSRQIPHRLEAVDYVPVRNDGAVDGRFKVGGRRQVIYVRRQLTVRDRLEAARLLIEAHR